MKQVIIATMLVSTGATAGEFDLPSIDLQTSNRPVSILPVAPVSKTGPTTVWQSGSYTYIDEPEGQTTVYQSGKFTYIESPKNQQTVCQNIGRFTYCN